MEPLLILIPLSLLGLLLYAAGAALWLGRRVRQLERDLNDLRADVARWRLRESGPTSPPLAAAAVARPPAAGGAPASPPRIPLWEGVPASVSAPVPAAEPKVMAVEAGGAGEGRWLGELSLEQFMGVKLFAWVGGLVLFLAAAFFLKHSFEQGWVSPTLRVTLGFLSGLGLVAGGMRLSGRAYRVTGHALCGAGVVILYAASFAAHAYYQLLGHLTAFGLMSVVTVGAFLLAARLGAMVVAVLGLLGGFLTPPLLSTGVDQPLALFGYIALLDGALVAVAWRRRWPVLVALAALGTVGMQFGWAFEFFAATKVFTALAVFAGFSLLFGAAYGLARREGDPTWWVRGSAVAMPLAAWVFVAGLLGDAALAARPGVLFLFLLVAEAGWLGLATVDARLRWLPVVAGGLVFLWLAVWTGGHLEEELLYWALGGYLGFAVVHTVFPVWLERRQPGAGELWHGHGFPLLALVLVMLPFLRELTVSWVVWPAVLLVDALACGLAVLTGSMLGVLGALALTVVVIATWLMSVPAEGAVLTELLVVTGGFAVVFFGVGLGLARRWAPAGKATAPAGSVQARELAWLGLGSTPEAVREWIPASAAVLPFLLLILAVNRLPLADPTPIFGMALLLAGLGLATARLFRMAVLVPVGLACVLGVEFTWQQGHFRLEAAGVTLAWQLGFTVLFAGYAFVFREAWRERVLPWATAALSGPLHFFLVYRVVEQAWPNEVMGLVPAAFAVPTLGGLYYLARATSRTDPMWTSWMAWFGGSALFFITLIFPVQFEREWLTVGWALEGAALVWLFRRVPHPGLRGLGVGLLLVAFVRLALNPAVLEYHARGAVRLLNWYLYTYGLATVSLILGARWLAPPRHRVLGVDVPPVLYALAAVLGFLLLNVQIADWFSTGTALTFDFRASLGQDMTYSIGWALYAFGLLILGFRFESVGARYGGMGLLVVTVCKLFLNDLFRLGGLYRVGSLIGLAAVLMLASVAYQRFFAGRSSGPDAGGAGGAGGGDPAGLEGSQPGGRERT